MAKPDLDEATWSEIRGHLAQLTLDAKPQWGKLNDPALLEHLNATLLLSLGELPGIEDKSTWFMRNIIGKIFHLIPLPKNVKAPDSFTPPPSTDNLETLLEVLDRNVKRFIEISEKNPNQIGVSPMFGPIPLRQWRKVQYSHMQHHLKQFRLTGSAPR